MAEDYNEKAAGFVPTDKCGNLAELPKIDMDEFLEALRNGIDGGAALKKFIERHTIPKQSDDEGGVDDPKKPDTKNCPNDKPKIS